MSNYIQVEPGADLLYENPRAGYYTVMFKREPAGVNGCPMGRGETVDAALADLKRRVEIESPVIIHWLTEEDDPYGNG